MSPTGLSPATVRLPSRFGYILVLLPPGLMQLPGLLPQPRPCNACRLHMGRFGLFPVRSPLLGESRLISLPAGTEMFQFPTFASFDDG